MFECILKYEDRWLFLDFRKDEGHAKARCTNHFKKFGHPQEYRIRKDGVPCLTGKTIEPRSGEPRIEWRDER